MADVLLGRPLAPALRARLFRDDESLHAPHLIDPEVLQAVRRSVLAGFVTPDLADTAVREYLDIRLTRHPQDFLLERAWQLRQNFTVYDAMYVALAEVLEAPLVTLDAGLAKAASRLTVNVELFA
jgi:predicted nucleic acid-binding protein